MDKHVGAPPRKVFLYMTMSCDGFFAGPNGELDWMGLPPDQELNDDIIDILKRADAGFMGYPTASGMIPYWASVARNPEAAKGDLAIANVVNNMHSIILSSREEKLEWANAELFLVKNDQDLIEGVTKFKQQPGKDLAVPGGIRTAQRFARLGLIDEYIFVVHPVAIGHGKGVFTSRVNLELISTKTYSSGAIRVCYQPR